jgi:hypothetical protein
LQKVLINCTFQKIRFWKYAFIEKPFCGLSSYVTKQKLPIELMTGVPNERASRAIWDCSTFTIKVIPSFNKYFCANRETGPATITISAFTKLIRFTSIFVYSSSWKTQKKPHE